MLERVSNAKATLSTNEGAKSELREI